MDYSEKLDNNVLKISINGDLDIDNTDSLREKISTSLAANTAISLDMSDISYIDSSGVAALIEIRQKADNVGKEFKLLKPSESVVSVLKMAKLDTFFVIEN